MRSVLAHVRPVWYRVGLAALTVLLVASLSLAEGPVSNQVVVKFPVPMQIGGYAGKALKIRPDLPEGMPLRASGQDLVVAAGFYPPGRQLAVFESQDLLATGYMASGGSQLRLAWLPSGELVVLDCEGNALQVRQVAGGCGHFVALLSDGRVVAWGANDRGQLGDGTRVHRAGPVLVQGVSGAVGVGAGADFSFAVLSDGRVLAWGANDGGQLGDGTKQDRLAPVYVKGVGGSGQLTGVVKVVGGSDHALALLSDGRVVAWGFNSYGQLGDNTTVSKSYPVYVNLIPPAQDVAAGGDFSLALKNGFVYAWGSNGSGQLGDGSPTTTSRPYPNPVKAPGGGSYLSQVVGIAAGKLHGLAVLSTGEVVAWGGNASGQLGDGTTQNRTVPVFVLDPGGSQVLSGIARVAGGIANSYAVTRDGEVLAWGDDQYGACGDGVAGSPGVQVVPTWVRGTGGASRLSGVTAVSAGYGSACAVLSGGTFVCWGNGAGGALGNDTWDISPVPVQVTDLGSPCGYLVGVRQVAAGLEHSLALLSGGRVAAWGWNDCGQLGTGDGAAYWSQAVLVKGAGGTGQLQGAVQVAAGGKHSLAVLADGRVLAWGSNSRGKLGDGTTSDRPVPVYVKDPSGSAELRGVVQVAAGRDAVLGHSLALLSDGHVLAWGANDYGQLGNGISGSGRYSALPVKVLGVGGTGELTGVVQVAAGYDHCLALLSDGSVVAWGNNDRGQLGDGTSGSGTGKAYPVRVRGIGGSGYLTGVVEIAAGYKCSLARLSDGRVVAWGYSYVLGDGSTADRSVPGYVKGVGGSGSLTGVVALAVHSSHAVAVLSDGRALAWGVNTGGPLGDGTQTTQLYPVLMKDASGAALAGASGCAAGGSHTLLVTSEGHSMGCGKNSYGQVGTWVDSYNPNVLNPVLVRKKWPGW